MSAFVVFNTDPATRDLFEPEKLIPANGHSGLIKSWLRSFKYQVDARISSAPSIQLNGFSDLDKLLLDVAKPYFKYFASLLVHSQAILTLSNANSIIIHQERYPQNRKINQTQDKHNFMVGADWSEKNVGTNSISMALEEKNNILLNGFDHYSYSFQSYASAGSPIFNLNSGEVLGVVAVTSFHNCLNVHSLGMGAAMARLIEKELIIRLNSLRNGQQSNTGMKTLLFEKKSKNSGMEIVGENNLLRSALRNVEKIANTQLNLFLSGETGTGKEMFARYAHNTSNRAQAPFVAVNCAAIPKELVSSELFGYIDGAFTGASRRGHSGRFEQANRGTIFLDEIGDAPYEVQVGLLRVLEEKKVFRLGSAQGIPVDVRVISATSRDLNSMVKKKTFREDLYYRLTGFIIEIPPLRERGEDIILLAEYFINKYTAETSRNLRLDTKTRQRMLEYDWPGNIRELKNVVERMATLTETELLTQDLFYSCVPWKYEFYNIDDDDPDKNPEKDELINAIKEANGNITKVADMLSIARPTVYRRMKKFGMTI